MDRASKRATYIPGQVDAEANKRNTVTERSVGKTERQRASTLLALGLAEEKEQALTEASLLSADVDDAGEIAASSYSVQILGTDLAAKKPGKAFTVRPKLGNLVLAFPPLVSSSSGSFSPLSP